MKKLFICVVALAGLLLIGCKTAPLPKSQMSGIKPVNRHTTASQADISASVTPVADFSAYDSLKNLALGKSTSTSGFIYEFAGNKAVDGDVNTYWEGATKKWPSVITVDLKTEREIQAIRLKLNPRKIWQPRFQTIEVQTSSDGEIFASIVPAEKYAFDPVANANTVIIPVEVTARYVRLNISANSEAGAGQLSEFEVLGE